MTGRTGIEPSADKLLQGRLFSYADTQRHSPGPNYLQIPINRPKVEINNNQRDRFMQSGAGHNGTANVEPNSLGGWDPHELKDLTFEGRPFVGGEVRHKIALTNDFQQARERYRSLSKKDQDHLVDNIVDPLGRAKIEIQKLMVENLKKSGCRTREAGCTGTESMSYRSRFVDCRTVVLQSDYFSCSPWFAPSI
jgi:catalase